MSEEAKTEDQQLTNLQMIEKLQGSDELNTLLKNSNESYWKNNIGAEVKSIYSNIDNKAKEILGEDKPEDIKTSDWISQKLSKAKDLEKELIALKGKGDTNAEQEKLWIDKVEKLKNEYSKLELKFTEETTKNFKQNIGHQVDSAIVGKGFKATYSKDDLKTLLPAKKAYIVENTRNLDNGKIAVWNPSENKYYTDSLGEPLTPAQVAIIVYEPMFQTTKKGGNTPTDSTPASIEGDVLAVDMNKVKTRAEFYTEFNKLIAPKGLASHSEQFQKIQQATMAHYNIKSLPAS